MASLYNLPSTPSTPSLHQLLKQRASGLAHYAKLQSFSPLLSPSSPATIQTHPSLLASLSFEQLLEGHNGCVNRLSWNAGGTLLASGSDDCHVRLWDWHTDDHRCLTNLNTGHSANIFAVGFLNNDASVVSAGMDCEIRVTDIETQENLSVYHCHQGERVKELCVDPVNDSVFLTAGEDGRCRLFDMREPHQCHSPPANRRRAHWMRTRSSNSADDHCNNAIVKFSSLPLKCVDINPVDSHLFLLSADDQFIRVYDRRMTGSQSSMAPCIARHAASHLKRRHCSTFAVWSEDGSQILASYSGEQVYLYEGFYHHEHDITDKSLHTTSIHDSMEDDDDNDYYDDNVDIVSDYKEEEKESDEKSQSQFQSPSALNAFVTRLKDLGNQAFRDHDYSLSICCYTEAILHCAHDGHWPSILYSNRAVCYLKRKFDGDINLAMKDAKLAWRIDRNNIKAAVRLIQALRELKFPHRALRVATVAIRHFQSLAANRNVQPDTVKELAALHSELTQLSERTENERKKEENENEKRSTARSNLSRAKTDGGGEMKVDDRKTESPTREGKRKSAGRGTTNGGDANDAETVDDGNEEENKKRRIQTTATGTDTDPEAKTDDDDNDEQSIGSSTSSERAAGQTCYLRLEAPGAGSFHVGVTPLQTIQNADGTQAVELEIAADLEVDDEDDLDDEGDEWQDDDHNEGEDDDEDEEEEERESESSRPRALTHQLSSDSDDDMPPLTASHENAITATPLTQSEPHSNTSGPRTHRSFINRYVGHANVQTDIKEATFWHRWVLSGSDDGRVFIWDRRTAKLEVVLEASRDVVNCVRGHPTLTQIVTSGIDSEIVVWSLVPSIGACNRDEYRTVLTGDAIHANELVRANQRRMRSGPGSILGGDLLQAILAGILPVDSLRELMFQTGGDGDEEDE